MKRSDYKFELAMLAKVFRCLYERIRVVLEQTKPTVTPVAEESANCSPNVALSCVIMVNAKRRVLSLVAAPPGFLDTTDSTTPLLPVVEGVELNESHSVVQYKFPFLIPILPPFCCAPTSHGLQVPFGIAIRFTGGGSADLAIGESAILPRFARGKVIDRFYLNTTGALFQQEWAKSLGGSKNRVAQVPSPLTRSATRAPIIFSLRSSTEFSNRLRSFTAKANTIYYWIGQHVHSLSSVNVLARLVRETQSLVRAVFIIPEKRSEIWNI